MSEQHYGVCYQDAVTGKWAIQVACKTYERAQEEAAMWSMETGAQYVVKPIKPKKEAQS